MLSGRSVVWLLSLCTLLCVGAASAQGSPAPSGATTPGRRAELAPGDIPSRRAELAAGQQGVLSALPALPTGSLVALLPPTNAPDTDGASNGEALQTLTEWLRGKGYRVMQPEQVSAVLIAHMPDGCSNPGTCDPRLALASLEADAVVSLAIWRRPESGSQVAIHVRRSRGYGQSELPVGEAGVQATALTALQVALDDSRLPHEVIVRVDTQPLGAKLRVDQTIFATTPARLLLLPGNHLLSVEAPGYVSRAQYFDVPEGARAPVSVSLQLSKVAGSGAALPATAAVAAPADHAQVEVSPWNNVIALALFGAAVPLLANVVYSAATRGDCVGEIDARNRCAERVALGAGFYTSAALAGAAVLGGASFLILQPLGSDSAPQLQGASLQWRRRF